MSIQEQRIALAEHLSSLRPDWEHNVTIMEPVPNEPALLYHISKDTDIREFIPQVSARTATKEDKSIPRVCTAYYLWGCIIGYAAVVFEFNHHDDKLFKGGYQIYGLPYTLAVRPSKRLLPDVDATEERWLVGFDPEHLQIKPVKLGKFFARTISTTRMGKTRSLEVVLYLEVLPGFGEFRIHKDLKVGPGYYKIICSNMENEWKWPTDENCVLHAVSKQEYLSMKKSSASTLSFEDVPVSARW